MGTLLLLLVIFLLVASAPRLSRPRGWDDRPAKEWGILAAIITLSSLYLALP